MTVYDWTLCGFDAIAELDGKENVVTAVKCRRSAASATHRVDIGITEQIEYDPTQPFTVFENLTKEQVFEWVENAMGAEKLAKVDEGLQEQLDARASNKVQLSLPW